MQTTHLDRRLRDLFEDFSGKGDPEKFSEALQRVAETAAENARDDKKKQPNSARSPSKIERDLKQLVNAIDRLPEDARAPLFDGTNLRYHFPFREGESVLDMRKRKVDEEFRMELLKEIERRFLKTLGAKSLLDELRARAAAPIPRRSPGSYVRLRFGLDVAMALDACGMKVTGGRSSAFVETLKVLIEVAGLPFSAQSLARDTIKLNKEAIRLQKQGKLG